MKDSNFGQECRFDSRLVVSLPIRVEWKGDDGSDFSVEGNTENIGAAGALVHLPKNLPNVGSVVKIDVLEKNAPKTSYQAEVLRLERNAARPLAALLLTGETDLWRDEIFGETAPRFIASLAALNEESFD